MVVEKSAIACATSGKTDGFLTLDWCDGAPLDTLSIPLLPTGSSSASSATGASSLLPSWVECTIARPPRSIGTVETMAQVHSQLFTRTVLAAAVVEHGVQVMIGEVERVAVEGGRAVGVVLKEGGRAIAANAVVLALVRSLPHHLLPL